MIVQMKTSIVGLGDIFQEVFLQVAQKIKRQENKREKTIKRAVQHVKNPNNRCSKREKRTEAKKIKEIIKENV